MRLRSLLLGGLTTALLLSGCSAAPEPKPKPTRSVSPSTSATPTTAPIVKPDAAFDVTCDDVTAEMSALLGPPGGPVREQLSLVSSPNWYAGPAQYMVQRPGGIVCSYDGGAGASWEITIIPGAQLILDDLARNGYGEDLTRCESGNCLILTRDGDALVSGAISLSELSAGDSARVEEVALHLAARASASQRAVELQDSELAGTDCLRLLPPEQLSQAWGVEAELMTGGDFGGWGVPAHTYLIIDEAPLCYYSSDAGNYEAEPYLFITGMPAGAWAFGLIDGRTRVSVAGADVAFTGVAGTAPHLTPYLDLLVGSDWIRLTTYDEGGGSRDLTAIAPQIIEHLSTGLPAPQ